MTVLRAGDAGRSDGEAMSTGSEVSEEGSDVVFPSSMPAGSGIVLNGGGRPPGGVKAAHIPGTYDASLVEILRLHRALAHSYTGPPTNPSRYSTLHRPRAFSADFGGSPPDRIPPACSYSPEPITPVSPASSDISSTASSPASSGTPCSTPKSKALKFNLATISENLGLLLRPEGQNGLSPLTHRMRSNSASALVEHLRREHDDCYDDNDEDDDEASDDDNDDYGFLSHYSRMFLTPPNNSSSPPDPPGMHKSKSAGTTRRLLPKRWRKPRWTPSKTQQVLWTPEGSCTWSSMSGRRVSLHPTCTVRLSTTEALALQKIALTKLQAMSLGCAITIPKDRSSQKRSKRSAFSLKRKTNSESTGSGWVFGIPLSKVNANDVELRRRKPSSLRERRESLDLAQPSRNTRKSSSSSVSSGRCGLTVPPRRNINNLEVTRSHSYHAGAISSDSLSETDSRSTGGTGGTGSATESGTGAGTNLIDALSLSSSAKLETWRDRRDSLNPHKAIVPYVVNTCCKHLETYGLHVLGIFRIGSSKKRVKQLREEFDSGRDIKLNEDHNPHDVGALLKEFFRDLPDPLLTKDLYNAFLATRKLKEDNRRMKALQLLVTLLPTANRDTLSMLLRFLALVVSHSNDTVDENGQAVAGNKMDSHNLATLFGPNILHKVKGGEFAVATVERAEERHDVISVVEEMIDKHQKIFEVTAELHDEVLRLLQETNPQAVDYLLKRKSGALGIETDPETSSSFYEESDSSSIPRSPSCSSETDSGYPRSLGEALALHQAKSTSALYRTHTDLRTHTHRPTQRMRSADPPPQLEMLKIPQFRISSPDQGWYRPDSRSPSPMSPRISPSPKAMKSATPDLCVRVLPDSPGERSSSTTHSLISPRPVRFRKQLQLNPSIPQSPTSMSCAHTLTVPSWSGLKRDRDSDSNSSLSSYYPSTSRSATNSPITPDAPHSWGGVTPPASPMQQEAHHTLGGASDRTTNVEVRTSSKQRPLGINVSGPSRRPPGGGDWQQERWKDWELLTKEHSDEFHERETLV